MAWTISQPPCEAVSWNLSTWFTDMVRCGQPPCEAVSWNTEEKDDKQQQEVSLLVRLWVEMRPQCDDHGFDVVSLLVRLWVEIRKYLKENPELIVSLLVRLWVEISEVSGLKGLYVSASLWGCELKFHHLPGVSQNTCQPPCEAVSWNIYDFCYSFECLCQPPCEAASWNGAAVIGSGIRAVSWNTKREGSAPAALSSASLSVEMPFWLCHNRHNIGQSLWETVNWKEEYGVIVVAARKLTSILLEEDCEINHSHI